MKRESEREEGEVSRKDAKAQRLEAAREAVMQDLTLARQSYLRKAGTYL